MNIDTGAIRLWRELTAAERESGRWVKLGEGEHARAQSIDEADRAKRLNDIFLSRIPGAPGHERRRGFDATGKPY